MRLKLLACMMAMVGCMGVLAQPAMAEVTCPDGMPRDKAATYAECSIKKEEAERFDLMSRVTLAINVIVGVIGVVSVAMIVWGFSTSCAAGMLVLLTNS